MDGYDQVGQLTPRGRKYIKMHMNIYIHVCIYIYMYVCVYFVLCIFFSMHRLTYRQWIEICDEMVSVVYSIYRSSGK